MKKNDLEVGLVLFEPKEKRFIQIKEITYTNETMPKAQYFVCSGSTEFFGDAQTTITRQVIYQTKIENYFVLNPISSEF